MSPDLTVSFPSSYDEAGNGKNQRIVFDISGNILCSTTFSDWLYASQLALGNIDKIQEKPS